MFKKFHILLILFVTFLCGGCGPKTKYVGNTTVPVDNAVFNNRKYFAGELLQIIDTGAIYQDESARTDGWQSCYKFYSTGALNLFHFPLDHILKREDFDPQKNGTRGIFYRKDDKIIIEIFTIKGYGFKPVYGIVKYNVVAEKDALILSDKQSARSYSRQDLPAQFRGL